MCVPIDTVASIARMNPSVISFSVSAMPNVVIIKQYSNDMAINDMMHNIVNLYGFFIELLSMFHVKLCSVFRRDSTVDNVFTFDDDFNIVILQRSH